TRCACSSTEKPAAITSPNPVRRAISAAISSVFASLVPGAAATTNPARPGRTAVGLPTRREGTSTPWAVQPCRRANPASTLARHRTRGDSRIIVHQQGVGERVVAVVAERQEHPAAPAGPAQLARAAVQLERGRLPALATHLQLAPFDPETKSGAERLHAR